MLHKELKQLLNRVTELESQVKTNEQKLDEKDQQIKEQQDHQNHQIENLQKQIISLQQTQNNMIIPNITDDCNFSSISTAFQWKFNPTEVKSGSKIFSPPFYNVVNTYCFQLVLSYVDDHYRISLYLYRGKYDLVLNNDIKTTKGLYFYINLFGKEGKERAYFWFNNVDYSIPKYAMRSSGYFNKIHNDDVVDLALDNYVHLRCYFKKDEKLSI